MGETKSDSNLPRYGHKEHLEGVGDIWDTVLGAPEVLFKNLSDSMNRSEIMLNTDRFATLFDTNDEKNGVMHIIEKVDGRAMFKSSVPLLEGVPNMVSPEQILPWSNEAEGEFCADVTKYGNIYFYAIKYLEDREAFEGAINSIKNGAESALCASIFGVSYRIERFKGHKFSIDSGVIYEMRLKEFLEKNKDKTKADFEAPVAYMNDTFRILWPLEYSPDYECIGAVEKLWSVKILGQELVGMRVNLANKDDGPIAINVYSRPETLGEYAPKIGDTIKAIVWLGGYLSEK